MPRQLEKELKFTLPEWAIDKIETHPLFRLHSGKRPREKRPLEKRLITTYFDTDSQLLRNNGFSLRVRKSDGKYVQTIKGKSNPTNNLVRSEWEWPISQEKPDLTKLASTPIGSLFPDGKDVGLAPILVTDIQRRSHLLELPDGTRAEAAMDRGVVQADGKEASISELELEVKEGSLLPLHRLALALHYAVPMMMEPESNAERGYRLRNDEAPRTYKFSEPCLAKTMSVGEAFRTVAMAALGHLLANQSAALAGDSEGVHQMRVAVRHLRTYLALFAPRLPQWERKRFEGMLRQFGRAFGGARDWDVFCLSILPGISAECGPLEDYDLLSAAAEERRKSCHAQFAAAVRDPAFTAFALGLSIWAEEFAVTKADEEIRSVAPSLIERIAEKVRDRKRGLQDLDDLETHALRKSLKKLRYSLDATESALPRRMVKTYKKGAKKLNKALGEFQDSIVATTLLTELCESAHGGLTLTGGKMADYLEKWRKRARREVDKRGARLFGG